MIERWVDLPVGAKAGLIVLTGGGLMSAAYFLIRDPQVIIVIGIGLALLVGLVLGYRWLMKKRKARKSKPFEDEIMSSGGSTPREVSDPSRRAQVDSLRKKFEEGLRVYRQRGKDLYSLPWYVVIGEPGSGKSAAIRNSGVGFPPGLQEEMQGVGGTINMDWFFTNDAVVLDTAGRLAFEEVDVGKTTEWKEFLRLLRVARPRCPINGMMLFIPADSLKNDTADELEKKGSKIAQQLDFMQQTLGVRFPLFVIISKADLLVGFSEFFEGIADPREQFQIFGWSNPNSLDTPFQPREIEGVLGEIRERIIRRRALLLKEPAPQTLVANRRIDEVDRMYLLPDETERIAPRLQRYLELIFAGGQWASPPPFLRGVYFTSALREGEAVDLALAEAIGAEASDSLEDRRWDTKRSFFLHDVFMEKVFRERGLVTAAPSPSRAKRSRRALLFGAISAILLVSIGLTGYSAYQFWHDLKGPEVYWNEVESTIQDKVNVSGADSLASFGVQMGEPKYFGADQIEFGSTTATHATLPKVLSDRITTKKIRAGGIFALFGAVRLVPDLERDQWDAQRAVLSATVVSPLLRGSLGRLANESVETWTEEATAAYTAVLGVWTRSLDEEPRGVTTPATAEEDGGGAAAAADADSLFPFEALSAYFLVGAEASQSESFSQQQGAVEEAILDAFNSEGGGRWRPGRDELAEADIERATESFLAHRTITRAPQARALVALAESLAAYRSAEQEMLSTAWFTTSTSKRLFDEDRRRWNESLDELLRLAEELESAREAAQAQGLELNDGPRVVVQSAAAEAAVWVRDALDLALLSLPEYEPGDSGDSEERAEGTEGIARRLEARRVGLGQDPVAELNDELGDLAELWGDSLEVVSSQPRYVWRLEAYQRVGSGLDDADLSVVSSISELRSLERGLADTWIGLVEASRQQLTGDVVMRDSNVLGSVASAGEMARRYQIATELLDRFGDEIATGVENAASKDIQLAGIDVRGTSLVPAYTVDRQFIPAAAGQVFEAWGWLAEITEDDGEGVVLGRAGLSRSLSDRVSQLNDYLDAYLEYWGEDIPRRFQVNESLSWSEYRGILPNVSSGAINETLSEVARIRADAIGAVPSGIVGDRATLVDEMKGHAEDAYRECKNDGFRTATGRAMRTGWNRLSSDASRARRELLDMEPGKLADDFLAHPTEVVSGASIGFWDSMVEGMMLSIASEAGNALSRGDVEVRAKLRSRPFCLSAQTSLTSADIAGLAASIEALLGSAGQNDAGEFGQATLGAGGDLDIRRIDDAIRDLRDAAPRLDSDRRRRLETAGAIAAWLEKEPEVVIRTLALSEVAKPADEHQTQVLKYLSIDGESLLTGNRGSFTASLALPQVEGLTLGFSTTQDGGADRGTVVLPAPWGILQLLPIGEPDPNSTEDVGKEWQVQVRVAGTDARIWIGLTFSEPLAIDSSDWPDCGGGE